MSCDQCAGTGTDSTLVATDPYPIYEPHPCGHCKGVPEMSLLSQIKNALLRRPTRVKVEITYPHSEFIPGAYTPGRATRRYGCDECGMKLRLSTFHGPVTW
ncbi:hypothetical protein DKT68_15370 [Micromonospora acroterricola]|uniref:Uncharacterized protein n=1 Tax=Micromonospora acroterricola TaxID=2202421 RepID=A0A317D765_9ACTN|nr:hypothetical protein [Micromonospora acroterricola]PWR08593.1 hypothetical protein DKT68_15370 [Micromonospora acroterricola]